MTAVSVQDEDEYEDLLGLWSDLESGLGITLSSPHSVREFRLRISQYDRWMQDLLRHDADVGLYLLFQLSTNSSVGYSASHALICATLCHLIALELKLPQPERDSLVHAALTMNIAMTRLQDRLAQQTEKLSPEQQAAIKAHAAQGRQLLGMLGIEDPLWLQVVNTHHTESSERMPLAQMDPTQRLARIVQTVDRYAAMISPRKSREGRTASESVRSILNNPSGYNDEVGRSLLQTVGLCPPGTYVRMDDRTIAVVMRRSNQLNQPHVAIVTNENGEVLSQPRLHRTSYGKPNIASALATSVVHLRLNHHLILQLGAYAARQS